MNGEWAWVAFAYAVFYGSLALYVGLLGRRIRRARARLDELR